MDIGTRDDLEALVERAEAEADQFGTPVSPVDTVPARWLNPPTLIGELVAEVHQLGRQIAANLDELGGAA